MRQLWRFVRVLVTTFGHTLYLSLQARRRAPAERARYRAHRQMVGNRLLCRMLGLTVDLEGTFPEGPMLVVCNHFGVLDPIVLASQMPVAFVAKSEMRRWPFVGWVTREMGVVFVERERRTLAGSFVDAVQEKMREGVSVLVFPEGTTSKEPAVRPFKTGAFAAVAGEADAFVLPLHLEPVTVEGQAAVGAVRERVTWADSPHSFLHHFWDLMGLASVRMRVRVGTPIATEGRDRKELARLAQAAVRALAEASGVRSMESGVERP